MHFGIDSSLSALRFIISGLKGGGEGGGGGCDATLNGILFSFALWSERVALRYNFF